jgi:hypothetical protein
MTSKEKAEELVSKYYNRIEHTLSEEYEPHALWLSKQCALIAVNELINDAKDSDDINFWKEVKQEIEKL